ncbi:vivid PAS protein VVD [Drepanopeziza brunnea f. sp. 'multigermtubi' MB_m1]|uniref:Vivid PAS protein VVD n=1 Tax=Marssonina brunnea f. sp. multigermtubi (strain MB_m1) TaxID=1072389 RepID=K1WW76_MARBU|nr:vivid PAS protein VVD [Drepanopeziza brunnea f. sp. 'multigermtubi' MB_m1]EKD16712.1 vivid PAS protein VVD [Drepanopeziza brunnea f. sp. 'multigermtubi' MB_m1]
MNGYPSENQQRNLQQPFFEMQDAAAAGGQYGGDSNIFSQIKDLYAPSGIDVLNILLAVKCRPNPQIDIGNIDSGVALVLCDADDLDNPIVYCSEPFMSLTGYDSADIIGKNCRFLQHPPGQKCADRDIISTNSAARRKVKHNNLHGMESQTRFVNFRIDGSRFNNILTLIPVHWEGRNYIVGLQADEGRIYR